MACRCRTPRQGCQRWLLELHSWLRGMTADQNGSASPASRKLGTQDAGCRKGRTRTTDEDGSDPRVILAASMKNNADGPHAAQSRAGTSRARRPLQPGMARSADGGGSSEAVDRVAEAVCHWPVRSLARLAVRARQAGPGPAKSVRTARSQLPRVRASAIIAARNNSLLGHPCAGRSPANLRTTGCTRGTTWVCELCALT